MKESIMYQVIGSDRNSVAETLGMHLPEAVAREVASSGLTMGDLFGSPVYLITK